MKPGLAVALAAALGILCGVGQAGAQEDSGRQKLDRVLAVLRARENAASKACLNAMNDVHQTEEQVKDLTKNGTGSSDKPNKGLEIATDVLGSDYDTATTACAPDASRACQDQGSAPGSALARACGGLNGPSAQ
jgi:hypothetical protein